VKKISIQDLKARLSAAISEAESGETILILRHNEPVARLSPAHLPHLHRGKLFGKGRIVPAVKKGTNGRYLQVLLEDRGDR
jgi:prevent-host-death family protein